MSEIVRSGRRGNFFIIENALIDDYLEKIGGAGIAIYCILAKHADRAGSTFVGLERMGRLSGLAKSTITKALASLVEHKLIKVVKTESPVAKTTFWVLPVPVAKPSKDEAPLFEEVKEPSLEETFHEAGKLFVDDVPDPNPSNKEEQDPSSNKTHKANKTPSAESGAVESPFKRIIELIDREYSSANDGDKCPWKNKRCFSALGDLLKRYGTWPIEKWEKCIVNRYASLSFMAARLEPWEFIPQLYKFADGPLNQFGRKLETGGNRGRKTGDFYERADEELELAKKIGSGNRGGDAD